MLQRSSRRFARRCTVILAPLVLAALVLPALALLLRSRLPGQAVLGPGPGDRLPWPVLSAVTGGWLLAGIAGLAFWLRRHRLSPAGVRWPAPLTWAAGAASGLRSAEIVVANLSRSPSPGPAWWAGPVPVTVIALGAGILGWFLAGADPVLPTATVAPGPDCPRLSLPPHTRAMWCRRVSSRRGLALAGLLAGLGLASVFTAAGTVGATGPLAVVLAAVLAAHSCASVRVDQQGIAVTQPLLRRTLIALPYAHVQQAVPAAVPTGLPRHHYGVVADGPVFGYRARPDGPALRLDVAGGRTCIVTVDDPHTAAALVNTQLDRRLADSTALEEPC